MKKLVYVIGIILLIITNVGCKTWYYDDYGDCGRFLGNIESFWKPSNYPDNKYAVSSIRYNNKIAEKISKKYNNCFYYFLDKNQARLWFYDKKGCRIVIFDVIETDSSKRKAFGGLPGTKHWHKITQKIKLIGIHRYDENLSWLTDAPYLSEETLENLYEVALESDKPMYECISGRDWQTFKLYRKDKKTMDLRIAFWRLEEWPKSKENLRQPLFKHIAEDIRRYGIFSDITPGEELKKYYKKDYTDCEWLEIYRPIWAASPDTMHLITEKEFFKLLK